MNWINKNNELPQENETVLIWYPDQEYTPAFPDLVEFINGRFIRNINGGEWEDDFTNSITYWCRIIKPNK